jgi:hypothetical protein
MVPNGLAYKVENFTLGNSTLHAVVAGGEVYAFFGRQGGEGEAIVFLTGIEQIKPALDAYYRSKGFVPGDMGILAQIHEGVARLSRTQDKGEDECRRLAGLEGVSCSDFECYKTACIARASSFCPNFAYGGAQGEFINVIWSFDNASKDLKKAYLEENELFAQVANSPNQTNVLSYLYFIDGLNRAATRVNSEPLFTYQFCFTPDYSLPNLTRLQLSGQFYMMNASRFFDIPKTAQGVRNLTLEGIERQRKFSIQAASSSNQSDNGTKYLVNITNLTSAAIRTLEEASTRKIAPEKVPVVVAIAAVSVILLCAIVVITVVYLVRIRKPEKKS